MNTNNIKTEIIAGITTFLSSMYIIVVNPSILSACGMQFSALVTATIIVSAISSILMGLYSKNPILLAPGMGINAYFTYSIVIGMNVPWQEALGTVFWSGIIFLLLSIFNIRTYIIKAIPRQLRLGVSVGIGLFITFIGFSKAGFIVAKKETLIGLGDFNCSTFVFVFGLIITAILICKKYKGALIIGIILSTIAYYLTSAGIFPDSQNCPAISANIISGKLFSWPDFSLFMQFDFIGALKFSYIPVIFAFLFTALFDSLSTFVAVAETSNLKDENGEPKNIKQSMIVDAFATILSGIFGTSSATSYIESAAGIREGGRTGITAITAGFLFIPFLFLSPILSYIPPVATAPALVLVGVFMMKSVISIDWDSLDNAFPAFLAITLIPMTYSISQGIIWSFLCFTVLKFFSGKRKEISFTLLVIDIFAILSLIMS
ncbi:MAG: hypothetical protein ACD_79C01469G0005 [uncultured bacterium]|nr:MAG: hypothetical protein ACD_79C01469G0005 [uncultured bacterium]